MKKKIWAVTITKANVLIFPTENAVFIKNGLLFAEYTVQAKYSPAKTVFPKNAFQKKKRFFCFANMPN